jgi:hypothetical protein
MENRNELDGVLSRQDEACEQRVYYDRDAFDSLLKFYVESSGLTRVQIAELLGWPLKRIYNLSKVDSPCKRMSKLEIDQLW